MVSGTDFDLVLLHSISNKVFVISSKTIKSHILLLVNLVFVPFAKLEALSLNLYTQQVSGILSLKSDSKIFPAFCIFIAPFLYPKQG